MIRNKAYKWYTLVGLVLRGACSYMLHVVPRRRSTSDRPPPSLTHSPVWHCSAAHVLLYTARIFPQGKFSQQKLNGCFNNPTRIILFATSRGIMLGKKYNNWSACTHIFGNFSTETTVAGLTFFVGYVTMAERCAISINFVLCIDHKIVIYV